MDCKNCDQRCCKSLDVFILPQEFAKLTKIKPDLKVKEFGDLRYIIAPCPFLDKTGKCSVYSIRPTICRSFPLTFGSLRMQKVKEMSGEIILSLSNICPQAFKKTSNEVFPSEVDFQLAISNLAKNSFEQWKANVKMPLKLRNRFDIYTKALETKYGHIFHLEDVPNLMIPYPIENFKAMGETFPDIDEDKLRFIMEETVRLQETNKDEYDKLFPGKREMDEQQNKLIRKKLELLSKNKDNYENMEYKEKK